MESNFINKVVDNFPFEDGYVRLTQDVGKGKRDMQMVTENSVEDGKSASVTAPLLAMKKASEGDRRMNGLRGGIKNGVVEAANHTE